MSQPKDYDPYATDPQVKQLHFPSAVSGRGRSDSGGGRDRRIDIWLQGLILAGILSLVGIVWTLRDEVTKMNTFVQIKADQYDREFKRINETFDRHDQRLTSLERSESTSNRQSHYRQER